MKDWHWFVIFAVILITPFLPIFLRSKCPACGKRRLDQKDTIKVNDQVAGTVSFLSFVNCLDCNQWFKRERTGPLVDSSLEEYQSLT